MWRPQYASEIQWKKSKLDVLQLKISTEHAVMCRKGLGYNNVYNAELSPKKSRLLSFKHFEF
jgi:hypothetical protein